MELSKLRREKGVSILQVAEAINIKPRTYKSYETEQNEPNLDTLKKLADYFDVSLDYLCGRKNKNIVPLDSLSEPKRQVIQELRALSDDQTLMLLGYMARIKERPIEEIIAKIKNTD